MPAQKRSYDTPPPPPEDDDSMQRNENHDELVEDGEDDSDGSASSSEDKDEFVIVKLAEIRKEVQCPICLGIIRKTRTVMECLHRFCRECIDKSMRLGNNECPACRTHCASRRSLRDDPNYDALIAALYPDIDKYEEEELAFHEEEKARNKQIQASIAQTLRRQSEALGRKRTNARATADSFPRRSQGSYRNFRGRRNHRADELQGSDEEDANNGHDGGKDSSSTDERCTEVKPKRYKRWGGARFCQPSVAADGGCDENDSEVNRDSVGASAGLVGSSEMLAWGRGGMRSHTRYGSQSVGNGKSARNSRLSKLLDCLRNSGESDDGYVALQTPPVQADEVEFLLVKELRSKINPATSPRLSVPGSSIIDPCKDELHILEEQETLMELQAMFNFSQRHLLLAYRQKLSGLVNS